MESNESETLRLLEVEYQRLQTAIDNFDEQRFKVKGWSVTAGGVFVALAINTGHVMLLVAAVPIVLFFALMEIISLSLQIGVMRRNYEIEQLIDSARREGIGIAHDSYEFGVGRNVFKEMRFRWRQVPAMLRSRPQVNLFYLGMVLSLLGGAVILSLV